MRSWYVWTCLTCETLVTLQRWQVLRRPTCCTFPAILDLTFSRHCSILSTSWRSLAWRRMGLPWMRLVGLSGHWKFNTTIFHLFSISNRMRLLSNNFSCRWFVHFMSLLVMNFNKSLFNLFYSRSSFLKVETSCWFARKADSSDVSGFLTNAAIIFKYHSLSL